MSLATFTPPSHRFTQNIALLPSNAFLLQFFYTSLGVFSLFSAKPSNTSIVALTLFLIFQWMQLLYALLAPENYILYSRCIFFFLSLYSGYALRSQMVADPCAFPVY